MQSAGTYGDFFNALRQRESGNNYQVVNKQGYAGAYQFGEAALFDLGYAARDGNLFNNRYDNGFLGKNGIDSLSAFLNNSQEQDVAADAWFKLLWSRIRANDLEFYNGQTLNGTPLTKTGMIAAAHLAGTGGLEDFIQSGGVIAAKDANGTSIRDYLKLFADYDAPAAFLDNLEKNNVLVGGTGDDTFAAGAGNDQIDGGAGVDTALYAGPHGDYRVTRGAAGFAVSGPQGADSLVRIERIQFGDGTLALDTDGNAGDAYRLYQAAFDRTPDTGGLSHWVRALDSGTTLVSVAANFIASQEFRQTYGPGLTDRGFVGELYLNVLDRAGEAAGVDYWTSALETGTSRATVLMQFSESVENVGRVSPAISDGIFLV